LDLSKKKLSILLSVVVLSTILLTSITVIALVPSETFVISSGVYPGSPSYTIWTDGEGNYYAKNSYGVLTYTGTSASIVLQNCLNDLNYGGTVFITCSMAISGIEIFPSADSEFSGINIVGESYSDPWNDDSTATLTFASDEVMFNIGVSGGFGLRNIVFKNLAFSGSTSYGSSYDGEGVLNFTNTGNVIIEDCSFLECDKTVIYFDQVYTSSIRNCWFYHCGDTNYPTVSYQDDTYVCTNAEIAHTVFEHSVYQEVKVSTMDVMTIDHCYFEGYDGEAIGMHPASYQLYIDQCGGVNVQNSFFYAGAETSIYVTGQTNSIINNIVEASGVIGIFCTDQGDFTNIVGNTVIGCDNQGIVVQGTGNVISENYIYNNGYCGILVNTGDDNVISENYIVDNDADDIGQSGIILTDATYNVINGNRITNSANQDWGIIETGTCDYNVITSCISDGNDSGGIYTVGANSKCNLCYNQTSWIS